MSAVVGNGLDRSDGFYHTLRKGQDPSLRYAFNTLFTVPFVATQHSTTLIAVTQNFYIPKEKHSALFRKGTGLNALFNS